MRPARYLSNIQLSNSRDTLDDLHVVHVEGADGIAAFVGFLEHFGGGNKRHSKSLLTYFSPFPRVAYHLILPQKVRNARRFSPGYKNEEAER